MVLKCEFLGRIFLSGWNSNDCGHRAGGCGDTGLSAHCRSVFTKHTCSRCLFPPCECVFFCEACRDEVGGVNSSLVFYFHVQVCVCVTMWLSVCWRIQEGGQEWEEHTHIQACTHTYTHTLRHIQIQSFFCCTEEVNAPRKQKEKRESLMDNDGPFTANIWSGGLTLKPIPLSLSLSFSSPFSPWPKGKDQNKLSLCDLPTLHGCFLSQKSNAGGHASGANHVVVEQTDKQTFIWFKTVSLTSFNHSTINTVT